jgi:hypothetical protein
MNLGGAVSPELGFDCIGPVEGVAPGRPNSNNWPRRSMAEARITGIFAVGCAFRLRFTLSGAEGRETPIVHLAREGRHPSFISP